MSTNAIPKLIETCGQLQVIAAKRLMHGAGLNSQLADEIAGVFAAMNFVISQLGLNREAIEALVLKRLESIERFDQIVNAVDEFDLQPKWKKRKPAEAPVEAQGRAEASRGSSVPESQIPPVGA